MANGESHNIPGISIAHGINPIEALAQNLLKDVKAGNISTLGVIAVNKSGGVAVLMEGQQHGDVYVGAGMMQTRIIRAIENPHQRPGIIPVRGG